jgi:hypothetical protein
MHDPTGTPATSTTNTNNLYRDALAAVLEAIDIPQPATPGDADRYRQVLDDRAEYARIALDAILKTKSPEAIAYLVEQLRQRLAGTPAGGYRAAAQRDVDGEAGQ